MASMTTTKTIFSSFLEKLLGSKNFEFPTKQENLIHHIKKLTGSGLTNILMDRGFNPVDPISDNDIIEVCVDILLENMTSAEVEDLPEAGYIVRFNFNTGGQFFFKTFRNRPAKHRADTKFVKIEHGAVYRSIVQPDPNTLPLLVEFYVNDIFDDLEVYEKFNK
jgi:hypothetical protein